MSSDQDFQKITQLEARMKSDLLSASFSHPCKKVSLLLVNETFPAILNENNAIFENESKLCTSNKNNNNDPTLTNEEMQKIVENLKNPENIRINDNSIIDNSIDLKTNQRLNELSLNLNHEEKADDHLKTSGLKRKKNDSDSSNDCALQLNAIINNTKITDFFFKRNELKKCEKNINFKNINSNLENKPDYSTIDVENNRLKEEIRKLNRKIVEKETLIDQNQNKFKELTQENKMLASELNKKDEAVKMLQNKSRDMISKLLLKTYKLKRDENRNMLFNQKQRLGEHITQRKGHKFVDIWIDGYEIRNLKEKMEKLKAEKENLEKQKKTLKPKKSSLNPKNSTSLSDSENTSNDFSTSDFKNRISLQLTILAKDEIICCENLKRLDLEKNTFIFNSKRQLEEENSRFSKADPENNFPPWPCLNNRYQLLCLLGKGGFSEVYKAFDLNKYNYIACKIHQLASSWSERAKSQYIKHALRETSTHHQLTHPNIVKHFETFEVDHNTLCTVLEFCDGPDLALYMKQNPSMVEKDIKCLIRQILSGLKYLHESSHKIIHYDIKPQNILFHKGELKISDFGLCKVMEDNATRLELTSQGVGTYWYLPPECFEEDGPLITTKVDLWSVGVITYEMIFGEKPFGHNMTQEKILGEKIILNAEHVKFNGKMGVSPEAKEFIMGCLTREQSKRWDVNQALGSLWIKKK